MKIGCVFRFLMVFTILLAIVLYLVIEKGRELLYDPVRSYVNVRIGEVIYDRLDFIKPSPAKDSLTKYINELIQEEIDKEFAYDSLHFRRIEREIADYTNDSTVSEKELEELKEEIKELKENAKRKKN